MPEGRSRMICGNPACGQEFTPKPRGRKTGRTSHTQYCCMKCWHKVRVAIGLNTDMNAARVGRMNAARRRMADKFRAMFGELSDRELAIVRLALQHGYHRGMSRMRYRERKAA